MARGHLKGLFVFCVLLLGLLAATVPFVERGTATFVIIQLSVVHLLAAMAIIGALLYFDWDPFRAFR
jgi:hypothetical protein